MSLYLSAEGRWEKPCGRGEGRRALGQSQVASGTGEESGPRRLEVLRCRRAGRSLHGHGSARPASPPPVRPGSPQLLPRAHFLLWQLAKPLLGVTPASSWGAGWGPGCPRSARSARPARCPVRLGRSHRRPQRRQPWTDSRATRALEKGCRGAPVTFLAARRALGWDTSSLLTQACTGTPAGDLIFKQFPNLEADPAAA